MQTHEELESLASGYAISALETEEKEAFESHLAACQICAGRVTEMRAVAEAIAFTAPEVEPSPVLRQRILDAARTEKAREGGAPGRRERVQAPLLDIFARPAVLAAVMGVMLLAIIGLALWTASLQSSLDMSEIRIARGYEAVNIMAQADRWWELEAADAAPNATGTLAYSSRHASACLVAFGMPPAPEGSRYFAWAIKGNQATNLGNMWAFSGDLWRLIPGHMDELDALVITLEEEQQPAAPTGVVAARVPLGDS